MRVGLEFFLAVLCLCTRLTDRSGEVRKCANLLVATPVGRVATLPFRHAKAGGGVLLHYNHRNGKQITESENFLDKKDNLA